jgi:predicted permease
MAAIADVLPNALAAHRDALAQDLRYAVRSLVRTPAFSITAIVLMALGVGANTAAFSLADFIFLRPLAYPRADRLLKIWQRPPDYSRNELSPANYRDWSAASTGSLAGFAALNVNSVNLIGSGEPRRLDIARVTPNLFSVVGVGALAGRTLAPTDSADPAVVVISYSLWQGQFGADRSVIGQVVRLDGSPFTIIGVMPASFTFPRRGVEAWMPLTFAANDFEDRDNTYLEGVARLRDGVSFEQARSRIMAAASRIENQYSRNGEHVDALVYRLRDEMPTRARLLVWALCGAAVCILLLACANLASLLLARAAYRAREMAVRAALGAGRERLVRLLVTESLALATIGGAVGIAIAALAIPLLARFVPTALPITEQPAMDARVLGIAFIVLISTALMFGVIPGRGTGDGTLFVALREGGRSGGGRTQRLRAGLVIVEVAASVVLLISSGLLIRAVWRVQSTDPGFHADGVLTLRTVLPLPAYGAAAKREQFYGHVLEEVRTIPGVQEAAYVTGLPMRMTGGIWKVTLPGMSPAAAASSTVSLRIVTPRFFAALGIPIRRGRDVATTDRLGRPLVAVVSESFAHRYWGDQDPIGKRFTVADSERTVVGVVGEVRVRGREIESEPQLYLPAGQLQDNEITGYIPKDLVVRSTSSAAALLPAIRRAVRGADPEQPISDVVTMPEILSAETAPRITQLRLLAILSGVALLIAGVGIHGLLTFTVSRRSQELAVRRALGARGRDIVGGVLGEGMLLATAGIAIGAALAYPAARAMGVLLAGVEPADPLTIGGVAALCLVTAAAGCLRPAVTAARVEPLAALRGE